MIKAIFRLAGLLTLAMALIAAVLDIARSIADSTLVITSLGKTLSDMSAVKLNQFQFAVQEYLHPMVWDPILQGILLLPGWLVLAVIALLFLWIGRKRKSNWQKNYGA